MEELLQAQLRRVRRKRKVFLATARKLRVNPSPSGEPQVNQWEVIPTDRPKFCVPAMPKSAPAKAELHRPESRDMIKQKIQELEFKVALDLFSAVARLVPKDEVRKNPKAKAALDKEWENLRAEEVWDESRVGECKSIVDEARRKGETVHLGRIFEACYEKGLELPGDDPRRKFKGRTVFQGNNVRDQDSDHALFAELGSSPASMEAAKLLDAFGSQPGFSKAQADAIQAYIQAIFTGVPTWCNLRRLFAMVSARAAEAEEEGVDEGVVPDGETDYIRSSKASDLEREASSREHQFCHYPKKSILQSLPEGAHDGAARKEKGRAEKIGYQKFWGSHCSRPYCCQGQC